MMVLAYGGISTDRSSEPTGASPKAVMTPSGSTTSTTSNPWTHSVYLAQPDNTFQRSRGSEQPCGHRRLPVGYPLVRPHAKSLRQ